MCAPVHGVVGVDPSVQLAVSLIRVDNTVLEVVISSSLVVEPICEEDSVIKVRSFEFVKSPQLVGILLQVFEDPLCGGACVLACLRTGDLQ